MYVCRILKLSLLGATLCLLGAACGTPVDDDGNRRDGSVSDGGAPDGGTTDGGTTDAGSVDAGGPTCGNGRIDADEDCEAGLPLSADCQSLGFGGGALGCAGCRFDTSQCTPRDTCNNGQLESNEICEGFELRGKTCQSLGYQTGELACTASCTLDTSDCACNPGYHYCTDTCVADDSLDHCGTSCTPCPPPPANATATCDGTRCGFACDVGYHACGDQCVPNDSVDSCGTSCTPCPPPPAHATATCDGVSCGYVCDPGYYRCASGCCDRIRQTQLALGKGHTCAIDAGGGLRCWGSNSNGQLGDGTTTDRHVPTPVVGLSSGVLAVATGAFHTCALLQSGALKCWGANDKGQLGDGTQTERHTPVQVSGLSSGVVAVTAGGEHTCAVLSSGAAQCWGSNDSQQIGDATGNDRSVPTPVMRLTSGVTMVTAGAAHTCALVDTGTVKCWGDNTVGQLGDGTTWNASRPVSVTGLTGTTAFLAAGAWHTCAVSTTGTVSCWGSNMAGQLGSDLWVEAYKTRPSLLLDLASDASMVAGGGGHTCVVEDTGDVECWGANDFGQLGNYLTSEQFTDVPDVVLGLPGSTVLVALGANHSCAKLETGAIWCWGKNDSGQLGDGTTMNTVSPVPVTGF